MSVHLEAKPGEIADAVLLPGDPLRAKAIAERYLTDVVCYNRVRNMLGFTGTYRGKRVSVQGTGMGMPSHGIYVRELIVDYGARTLLRVGTCGAIQERIGLRDVVLAMSASTDSGMNRKRFRGMDFAPTASFSLLERAHHLASERGLRVAVGNVVTCDFFYDDDTESYRLWARYGSLVVEMETAELYTLAALFGARALSVLTVSDHVCMGQSTTQQDREQSLNEMVELAFDTALCPPNADEATKIP